jgi:hypothetical protein
LVPVALGDCISLPVRRVGHEPVIELSEDLIQFQVVGRPQPNNPFRGFSHGVAIRWDEGCQLRKKRGEKDAKQDVTSYALERHDQVLRRVASDTYSRCAQGLRRR